MPPAAAQRRSPDPSPELAEIEMVCHDLKAPLQAIVLGAEMALQSLEQGEVERARRTLSRVQSSALAAAELVRQILDAGRPVRPVEARPLAPLVRKVIGAVAVLADAKAVALCAVVQTERAARCDALRLKQALANLVTNAIRFTPPGGRVEVRVQDGGPETIVVSVQDDGPGIAEQALPHLYDRGWSGGAGDGLGLFFAKAIVEAHGGALYTERRPGKGATFTFSLPTAPSARARP